MFLICGVALRLTPAAPAAQAECKIFLLKDCPIANQYAPELRRLSSQYSARGVKFVLVFEDEDITAQAAAEHARAFRLQMSRVLDPTHRVARQYSANVSPTAALTAGGVQYVGRIDNRYAALGKRRSRPTSHDLRQALDAVLSGKRVSVPRTDSIGCKLF